MAVPATPSSLPAQGAVAVTPSDGTDLAPTGCRALFIGTGGNISIDTQQGDTAVIHKNVASGSILQIGAKRVRATGTTATDIVAWY